MEREGGRERESTAKNDVSGGRGRLSLVPCWVQGVDLIMQGHCRGAVSAVSG